MNVKEAFKLGRDCGRNGPNKKNCSFSVFKEIKFMEAWERGKKLGDKEKREHRIGKLKRCRDCLKLKSLSLFYDRKLRDGRKESKESRCKKCSVEQGKQWRLINREKYNEYYKLRMRRIRAERRKSK